jgi:hypothetical protein
MNFELQRINDSIILRFSDPSSEMNSILDVKWDPVKKTDPVYLDINKELSMRRDLLVDRVSLWNEALDPL